jgi:hypothetical protein
MSLTAKPSTLARTGEAKVIVVVALVSSSTRVLMNWMLVDGPEAPKSMVPEWFWTAGPLGGDGPSGVDANGTGGCRTCRRADEDSCQHEAGDGSSPRGRPITEPPVPLLHASS